MFVGKTLFIKASLVPLRVMQRFAEPYCFLGRSVDLAVLGYFGRVIAPSDADETSAAYFPNTPVG